MIAPDVILTAQHCIEDVFAAEIGRYNISNSSETYETFVFQEIVNHPMYLQSYPNDLDPYDYALIKIYDVSKNGSPIALNTNPNVPSTEEQELYVIGWGRPTVNGTEETSDVLQQADVQYIPNEECRNLTGYTPITLENPTADYVNLTNRIFDIALCAENFKDGKDACTGDSGGPIFLNGGNASSDLQLGVTSYGFGCANPTLPGIYARVSYVADWIAENVCRLSLDPPPQFNCTTPIPSPDFTGEMQNVTFQFTVDTEFPEETGWILQGLVDDVLVTYHNEPIGSYRDAMLSNNSTVSTTISLPNNREYVFTIFDSFGDGNVAGTVLLGSTPILVTPTMEQGYSISYDLVLGTIESSSPTVTPAPTNTVAPSVAPTMEPPFVTVDITLDAFPEETGWLVEALLENGAQQVLQQVYPGTYNNSTVSVNEQVNLLPVMPMTYRFTISDNEGDGICCVGGINGSYHLFFGSPEEDKVLAEGADFVWTESVEFTVKADGTVVSETKTGSWPTDTPPPTWPTDTPPPTEFAPIQAPTSENEMSTSWATRKTGGDNGGGALLLIMAMLTLLVRM